MSLGVRQKLWGGAVQSRGVAPGTGGDDSAGFRPRACLPACFLSASSPGSAPPPSLPPDSAHCSVPVAAPQPPLRCHGCCVPPRPAVSDPQHGAPRSFRRACALGAGSAWFPILRGERRAIVPIRTSRTVHVAQGLLFAARSSPSYLACLLAPRCVRLSGLPPPSRSPAGRPESPHIRLFFPDLRLSDP